MNAKITLHNFNFWYGAFQALKNINGAIPTRDVTALIGPSGCGKSTLLRCFNRMNDLYDDTNSSGELLIDNENILAPATDLISLRRKVGMVFQRPNVFNLSIYENIAFGLKIHRLKKNTSEIMQTVEESLESVGLWIGLKEKLSANARSLSLEQQQRLCIARVTALKPDIVLLDEPCSTLDPIATLKIEELLVQLKKTYSIIIVTHNMQQAARISSYCGVMLLGELIEFGETDTIFTAPSDERTENYITGKFG